MLYLLYEVLHLEHLGLLFLEAIFCSEIDQRCYDNPISTTTSWSLSMQLKSHNNAPPAGVRLASFYNEGEEDASRTPYSRSDSLFRFQQKKVTSASNYLVSRL